MFGAFRAYVGEGGVGRGDGGTKGIEGRGSRRLPFGVK